MVAWLNRCRQRKLVSNCVRGNALHRRPQAPILPCSGRGATHERRDALEVCERVHVRSRALECGVHLNAKTVLERAQLLEFLAPLEWRDGQLRQALQRADPVRIDADVAPRAGEVALAAGACGPVAVPGNRRAAEVERAAGEVRDDLDGVGIEELIEGFDGRCERAYVR